MLRLLEEEGTVPGTEAVSGIAVLNQLVPVSAYSKLLEVGSYNIPPSLFGSVSRPSGRQLSTEDLPWRTAIVKYFTG